MNHLKQEVIQCAYHSSVKLTINLLMIFQSVNQKSKEIYLFTINSQPLSHYQNVFQKVGHQNVAHDKAGNILPLEQNISLLHFFSEVNFDVFFIQKPKAMKNTSTSHFIFCTGPSTLFPVTPLQNRSLDLKFLTTLSATSKYNMMFRKSPCDM